MSKSKRGAARSNVLVPVYETVAKVKAKLASNVGAAGVLRGASIPGRFTCRKMAAHMQPLRPALPMWSPPTPERRKVDIAVRTEIDASEF